VNYATQAFYLEIFYYAFIIFCWEWNRIIFTEKHFMEDTAERNSFQRNLLVESWYEIYVGIKKSSKSGLLFLIFPFLFAYIHSFFLSLPSFLHSFFLSLPSFIHFSSAFSLPCSFSLHTYCTQFSALHFVFCFFHYSISIFLSISLFVFHFV